MVVKEMIELAELNARQFGGIDCCDNVPKFMSGERLSKLQGRMSGNLLKQFTMRVMNTLQWRKYGYNVFDVTDSLLAGLLLTTPTDEPGFPRFPYPSFIVRISPGFIPTRDDAGDGGEERSSWVTHILVNGFQEIEAGAGDAIWLTTSASSPDFRDIIDELFAFSFKSPADYLKEDDERWARLEEAVDKLNGFDYVPAECKMNPSRRKIADLTQRTSFRVVANLCSWIESIGGMAGRRPSNAILRSANRNKIHAAQWVVGREVKLEPEMITVAKEHILGLNPRTAIKGCHLRTRFPIRGHIRHQACGKNRTERKVIWIKPHFHGPAGGDVLAHVYRVGAGQEKRT